LAETIVAGKIVGTKIVEFLQANDMQYSTAVIKNALAKDQERIDRLISGQDGHEDAFEIRNAMQDELMERVGIFRNGKDLKEAVDNLLGLYERAKRVGIRSNGRGANPELSLALKIQGMVRLALCVAYGALQRTESRGCHAREDYEARNDRDWLSRTLATWKEGEDLPTLNYEPPTELVELPPGERGYGVCKIISCDGEVIGA
jgi:fumarate reductase flavoprotein subunit